MSDIFSDRWWLEFEAIISDIEAADKASCGQYRQAEDREALDMLRRMERRLQLRKAG